MHLKMASPLFIEMTFLFLLLCSFTSNKSVCVRRLFLGVFFCSIGFLSVLVALSPWFMMNCDSHQS